MFTLLGAYMLTPAERVLISTSELSITEKKSLLRRFRVLISTPKEERKKVLGPTKKFGPLMMRWILAKMIVVDPVTVYVGFPLASVSLLVLAVQLTQSVLG